MLLGEPLRIKTQIKICNLEVNFWKSLCKLAFMANIYGTLKETLVDHDNREVGGKQWSQF